MVIFDCEVTEHDDGTIEATLLPDSARFIGWDQATEPREPETFDTTGEPS